MLKRIRFLALAGACALALSACNSADAVVRDYNQSDIASYDTSSVAVNQKIAAMVPTSVKADGKLTIGSNLYYAPADFKQGETPVGYEMDVMRAVAARMGLKLDIQESTFDSILPGIPKKYEVGASAFTITSERTANFNMIQYYKVGTSWAVAAGNPTKFSPFSICGRTVGVQTGTLQDDEMAKKAKACKKKPTVQRYGAQEDVTLALRGGKIEAMTADSSVITYALSRTKGTLEGAGPTLEKAPQGIVISKNDPALTSAVQASLQSLMDDGTLKKIFKSWNITEDVATKALLNPEV